MSTTTTTPCRVPPPGDASTEMARLHYDATPAQRCVDSLTVGEKVVLDHMRGRLHFGPLCRLCATQPPTGRVRTNERSLLEPDALGQLRDLRTLEQIVQQLLGRKVFVVERSDAWGTPARSSERVTPAPFCCQPVGWRRLAVSVFRGGVVGRSVMGAGSG